MENWYERTEEGVLLRVRVIPRATRNQVSGLHDGALKIRLTAPPVEGKANKALCSFLAKSLNLAPQNIQVVSGETSRQKRIYVRGVKLSDLKALCPEGPA
jgi:uncharacterized protein (TIGR00251 family)